MARTIKQKLYGTAAISVVATLTVGIIGYTSILRLSETSEAAAAVYAEAIRYQVESDMFHDALNSDVQAALLAGVQEDGAAHEQAMSDVEEHAEASSASPSARWPTALNKFGACRRTDVQKRRQAIPA